MPIYEVTDPNTGQVLELEGDSPPTEAELEQIFAQSSQLAAATPAQQPEQPTAAPEKPQEAGLWEKAGQAILEAPGGAAVSEFAAAVNRGAINILDFMGPDQINAALQLIGSEKRVPTLREQPSIQAATTGEFMEPGLAREMVRTGGEFVAPAAGIGAGVRALAAKVPQAGATLAEKVIQSAAAAPQQEIVGAAIAGAGSEAGAAVGEAVGGETGERIGRFVGGLTAPIAGAIAKETGKALVTQSSKKLLSEAAPTVEGLKQAARTVYREIDDLGVSLKPIGTKSLSARLASVTRKEGFNPTIHPKVNAALKEFESVAGTPQKLSEIDTLRRVANSAAQSAEPSEARLGRIMVENIDNYLDDIGKGALTKTDKNVGAKYRDARQLWGRARRAEILQDAFDKAGRQATGFENGIRVQFRQILNNKRKAKGFTKEELQAMEAVVKGTTLQNTAKMLGRFGFSEGQASNMLMGSLGVAGGAAAGGPAGAVAVPLIGQVSRSLAQKLTRKGAQAADEIVRAGKSGVDVVKAYMKAIPKKEQSAQELTELLLRPDISLRRLEQLGRAGPQEQRKIISDAVFLVNAIKAQEGDEE